MKKIPCKDLANKLREKIEDIVTLYKENKETYINSVASISFIYFRTWIIRKISQIKLGFDSSNIFAMFSKISKAISRRKY